MKTRAMTQKESQSKSRRKGRSVSKKKVLAEKEKKRQTVAKGKTTANKKVKKDTRSASKPKPSRRSERIRSQSKRGSSRSRGTGKTSKSRAENKSIEAKLPATRGRKKGGRSVQKPPSKTSRASRDSRRDTFRSRVRSEPKSADSKRQSRREVSIKSNKKGTNAKSSKKELSVQSIKKEAPKSNRKELSIKSAKKEVSVQSVKRGKSAESKKGKKKEKSIDSNPEAAKTTDKSKGEEPMKKITMKGKVPVDEYFPLKQANYHVLEQNGKVWASTLNQTNVSHNNNKFYILQVLQLDSNPNSCYFFTRWGRVGVPGQNSNVGPLNAMSAIGEFQRKLRDKTRKGEYREVELNYDEDEEDKKDEKKDSKEEGPKRDDFKESKLSRPVKRLIELIFDTSMMKQQMVEIGYNPSKMPLGKLSKDSIKKGFKLLEELMEELKGGRRDKVINDLTNDFYSYIPHDVGFRNMSHFVLNSQAKVKAKIEMLESLSEIKLAHNIIEQSKEDENQIDANYKKLNRDIRAVEHDSEEFKLINNYLQSTHASTHSQYKLHLEDLFALKCEFEDVRYTKHIDNKMLLWHGSRLTNFVGILSQGLRIAPPEAPATGYMFGKGVYLADMSSKSANYCCTSSANSTGILLLCESALGNMNEKLHSDFYASNLPPGKNSTWGQGRTAPDPKNRVHLEGDVVLPMGPGGDSGVAGASLLYNEFIVYDVAQIRIKYLLRTRFEYKRGSYW